MEEGSLLQEALSKGRQQQAYYNDNDDEPYSKNALMVDIFLLSSEDDDDDFSQARDNNDSSSSLSLYYVHHLTELAKLAKDCNDFFQSSSNHYYSWHVGGDGPVFGIHCSSSSTTTKNNRSIPHLRGICRYGCSLADEWMTIYLLMQFAQSSSSSKRRRIAIECWDVDDGQILLIQSADVLPDWVDQIGPEACRHVCWITNGGQIQLLQPTSSDVLTLQQALEMLQSSSSSTSSTTYPRIQYAIEEWIQQTIGKRLSSMSSLPQQVSRDCDSNHYYYHKGAILVPRSVAIFMKQYPYLVNAVIVAFARYANLGEPRPPPDKIKQQQQQSLSSSSTTNKNKVPVWEDWVWTTHSFSKTNYAMLRTIVTSYWKTEHYIPKKYQTIETIRLKRVCSFEATDIPWR